MKHTGLFSYFTRFDFIVNGEDIKLIEVNCDTPTGYLEPSVANEVLCRYHDVNHPNHIEEHIVQAWEQIKHDYSMILEKRFILRVMIGMMKTIKRFNFKKLLLRSVNGLYRYTRYRRGR